MVTHNAQTDTVREIHCRWLNLPFHSLPLIFLDRISTFRGGYNCQLVQYVWEFLANFSKLVMTSVLSVRCGKMQQLSYYYILFICIYMHSMHNVFLHSYYKEVQ